MTDEHSSASANPASGSDSTPPRSGARDRAVIIRMWPKTPVLYPMALIALICSLVAHFAGSSDLSAHPFGTEAPAVQQAPVDDSVDDAPEEGVSNDVRAQAGRGDVSLLAAQAADEDVPENSPVAQETAAEELEKKRVDRNLAVIFLLVLFFSLFAICVDLDVRWFIIYTSAIIIAVLLIWILNITFGFMPALVDVLDETITPMANAKFYLGVSIAWLLLLVMSFIVTRFHYVRVEANEVIVVGGMLERQQRYDIMRMRYTKEIHDVMEYYLPFVRSGRLIFSFPEQSEAVIIDNVLNINRVTRKLDNLVGSVTHSH